MSKTLLVEIRNIAIGVIILGAVQVLVTLPTKFFGLSAIFGTLLGCAVAILNFALMGIILERCVSKQKGASGLMGVGYIGRLALIALVECLEYTYPHFVVICILRVFVLNNTAIPAEQRSCRFSVLLKPL